MVNKHTPGPWGYLRYNHWNNPNLDCFEITYGEHGEAIADTVYEEADARLIAAAPQMLEALERECRLNAEEASCCLDCNGCFIGQAIKAAKGGEK